MKLVVAIVRPSRLDEIKAALATAGVHGFTVTDAGGFGAQLGHTEVYRGASYNVDFMRRTRVEIVVDDEEAETVAKVIVSAARTGSTGDGMVWITPLDSVMRVRDGASGDGAL